MDIHLVAVTGSEYAKKHDQAAGYSQVDVQDLRAVLELQEYLIDQTARVRYLAHKGHLLGENAFEALCFCATCYRTLNVTREIIEYALILFNIPEEVLCKTIWEYFAMHACLVPSSLCEVVKKLSELLLDEKLAQMRKRVYVAEHRNEGRKRKFKRKRENNKILVRMSLIDERVNRK